MSTISLGEIYLVTERVNLVPDQAVDSLAVELGVALPNGYREFITQLGIGAISGFLHVHSPDQVTAQMSYWKQTGVEVVVDGLKVGRFKKGVLSPSQLRESVLFGSTDNGDKFVSTPSCGETLFAIPRDGPQIRSLRHGFLDPLACCHAVGVSDVSAWFESQNGQRRLKTILSKLEMEALETAITERWGSKEIRRFDASGAADSLAALGVRAIQGMIRINTIETETRRDGLLVSVTFDSGFASQVQGFAKAVGITEQK